MSILELSGSSPDSIVNVWNYYKLAYYIEFKANDDDQVNNKFLSPVIFY